MQKQKKIAEQQKLKRKIQQQEQEKILKQAERKKLLRQYSIYKEAIQKIKKNVKTDIKSFQVPKEGEEKEALEILKDKFYDLKRNIVLIGQRQPMIRAGIIWP